jgi:hypothetical protein
VIRLPQNLGYCMAYNLAMPYAIADGCEWVIWANNDIRLEPGCLANLVEASQSDLSIGVLGPAFLAWESNEPNDYMLGNHPYTVEAMRFQSHEPIDVEWVEGSFLMVSRRCLEAVGPLDSYLYFYWEDADFCRRARFQGWRVVLVPNALARHYAGGWSSANGQNLAQADQLKLRNLYIYKLANPYQAFLKNFLEALHLFLVKIKESCVRDSSSIIFQLKFFLKIISEMKYIYRKWNRDRMGKSLPAIEKDILPEGLQVIKNRA